MSNPLKKLEELLVNCGKENWDSYGAKPILSEAIIGPREFLSNVNVVATSRGGVCLEFIQGEWLIEVEFDGNGKINSVDTSKKVV